jgi:hypothetical protein
MLQQYVQNASLANCEYDASLRRVVRKNAQLPFYVWIHDPNCDGVPRPDESKSSDGWFSEITLRTQSGAVTFPNGYSEAGADGHVQSAAESEVSETDLEYLRRMYPAHKLFRSSSAATSMAERMDMFAYLPLIPSLGPQKFTPAEAWSRVVNWQIVDREIGGAIDDIRGEALDLRDTAQNLKSRAQELKRDLSALQEGSFDSLRNATTLFISKDCGGGKCSFVKSSYEQLSSNLCGDEILGSLVSMSFTIGAIAILAYPSTIALIILSKRMYKGGNTLIPDD